MFELILNIEAVAAMPDRDEAAHRYALFGLMQPITGHEPQLWNVGTIGFDSYHVKYDSGREGDAQPASFYPRKGKLTIYLMDGTVRHTDLLARLGKHTTSRVCLYIKPLGDIDLSVLAQIVRDSYEYAKSQDGHMHRAME